MKSIFALSVLFVAQAVAKIGFGKCPLPTFMTYSGYQAAYPAAVVHSHKMVFGDKGLDDFLGIARTFYADLPNFKCGDLFGNDIYYADVSIWNTFFNQPADALVLGLLDFHFPTKSEAIYYCIDTSRAPALFYMIKNAGIPIPQEVIDAYSMINQIQNSLNFLDIQFRFEGMFVTTADYAAYDLAAPSAWVNTQIAKVPEYTRDDFIDYKGGC